MIEELSPCPFCFEQGQKFFLDNRQAINRAEMKLEHRFFIQCGNCKARGPEKKTQPEALEVWKLAAQRAKESENNGK